MDRTSVVAESRDQATVPPRIGWIVLNDVSMLYHRTVLASADHPIRPRHPPESVRQEEPPLGRCPRNASQYSMIHAHTTIRQICDTPRMMRARCLINAVHSKVAAHRSTSMSSWYTVQQIPRSRTIVAKLAPMVVAPDHLRPAPYWTASGQKDAVIAPASASLHAWIDVLITCSMRAAEF